MTLLISFTALERLIYDPLESINAMLGKGVIRANLSLPELEIVLFTSVYALTNLVHSHNLAYMAS
jgi:hypothetical protein